MEWKWWKILGILFIFISLTVGMLTPLRPGIVGLSPIKIEAGNQVTFQLEGYNTTFSKSNPVKGWLWIDKNHVINATKSEVINEQRVNLVFEVPFNIPFHQNREAKVSIFDQDNGFITALARPYINGGTVDPVYASNKWNGQINDSSKKGGYNYPFLPNIYESVRNTFYHVSLWFAMFFTFTIGVFQSVQFLRTSAPERDLKASSFTATGILFGILGLVTGMIWANYTWGKPWSWDIKQTMTAILLLVYLAYFVLRISFDDEEQRARISAIYNIFAFACIVPLLYVIPRLVDSLHPGGQGNPAFGKGDLDMNVRIIFYLSVLGWCMIGYWLSDLSFRAKKIDAWIVENDV